MLWMEGDLVAVGGNGCSMDFVGQDLQTPNCTNDMWIAIQAVDSEANSLGGHSKGGIKAAMKWCGHDIVTDDSWECSTVAESSWQKPIADGYDPRMEFESARDLSPGQGLSCRHRELPSCSWVHRNTIALEPGTECPTFAQNWLLPNGQPVWTAPPGPPSALCKQEALLADCASRTTSTQCTSTEYANNANWRAQGRVDYENRGVCRWEPDDPVSAPCGTDANPAGKCVLDLTCTHFSKADSHLEFSEADKQGKTDDQSNVLDNQGAKWIWVGKDTNEWTRTADVEHGPGTCAWCGRQEYPTDPCSEDECRATDRICKWDPTQEGSGCRIEDPALDEDTVYCRKHVQCTPGQVVDPVTKEEIVCAAPAEDQRRNLTLGCGQCQMCKNLAYQSPGDHATTQTCVQAYNEPCEAFYRRDTCIDPVHSDAERLLQNLRPCPVDAKTQAECTDIQGCLFVPAIQEEGTTCPEKWGGVIPKLSIDKGDVWGTITRASPPSLPFEKLHGRCTFCCFA